MGETLKRNQGSEFLQQIAYEATSSQYYMDFARTAQMEPQAVLHELGPMGVLPFQPGSIMIPGGVASSLVPEAVGRMQNVDTIIAGIHTGGSPRTYSYGPQTAKPTVDWECSCGLTGDNNTLKQINRRRK